jgi:methylmalonyl-CoA mutase N-terminal domain/subunit
MPYILESVQAYATEGEIMNTLIEVFGIYTERAVV